MVLMVSLFASRATISTHAAFASSGSSLKIDPHHFHPTTRKTVRIAGSRTGRPITFPYRLWTMSAEDSHFVNSASYLTSSDIRNAFTTYLGILVSFHINQSIY